MGRLCAEAPLDRQFLGTRFRVSEGNVLSGAYAFMSLQHCRKLSQFAVKFVLIHQGFRIVQDSINIADRQRFNIREMCSYYRVLDMCEDLALADVLNPTTCPDET